MKRVNKWLTVYVVQGTYGYGWEDLTSENTRKEARERLREYNENEHNPHRLITRRELNPEYKPTGA